MGKKSPCILVLQCEQYDESVHLGGSLEAIAVSFHAPISTFPSGTRQIDGRDIGRPSGMWTRPQPIGEGQW